MLFVQVQFPERLGCAVLLSPPSIFQLCWALVSPFLDRRTKEKIHFVARPESGHGRAMLDALFDAAVVDTSLGAFKPAEYSAWAAAQEAAWLAARGRGGHAHHGGHGHHGHTNGHRDGLHAGGEGAEVWHDAVESHEP